MVLACDVARHHPDLAARSTAEVQVDRLSSGSVHYHRVSLVLRTTERELGTDMEEDDIDNIGVALACVFGGLAALVLLAALVTLARMWVG